MTTIRRDTRPFNDVLNEFVSDGWMVRKERMDGRVAYIHHNGINLRVIDGPGATLVVPAGPVGGAIFGEGVGIGVEDTLGENTTVKRDADSGKLRAEKTVADKSASPDHKVI